ncbi:MAG: hypothetical protein ABI878_12105 [Acidobacteriota bacterium]
MDISASVGRRQDRNCQNRVIDQQLVRTYLNCIPTSEGGTGGTHRDHLIDGICSDSLYQAILVFQQLRIGPQADGHIDPNGPTFSSLKRCADQAMHHAGLNRLGTAVRIAPLASPSGNRPPLGDGGSFVDSPGARSRREWNNFVSQTRSELRGNPNSGAVIAYLERLERSAGPDGPSITDYVAFGEVTTSRSMNQASIQNAFVMHTGERIGTFDGTNALILMPNQERVGGSLLPLAPHTLMVLLSRYSFQTSRMQTASDTRLENGSLRSHLGQLAGRP